MEKNRCASTAFSSGDAHVMRGGVELLRKKTGSSYTWEEKGGDKLGLGRVGTGRT